MLVPRWGLYETLPGCRHNNTHALFMRRFLWRGKRKEPSWKLSLVLSIGQQSTTMGKIVERGKGTGSPREWVSLHLETMCTGKESSSLKWCYYWVIFFFFATPAAYGSPQFLGKETNRSLSSALHHSCGCAGSLTCCTTAGTTMCWYFLRGK